MELSRRGVSSSVCTCSGAGSLLLGNLLYIANRFTLYFSANNYNKMAVYLFCRFSSLSETLCILGTYISYRFQGVSVLFHYRFQGSFPVPLNSRCFVKCYFRQFIRFVFFFFLKTSRVVLYEKAVTTFLEENICYHFKSHWLPQASTFTFLQSLLCNCSKGKLQPSTGFKLVPLCPILLFLPGTSRWN